MTGDSAALGGRHVGELRIAAAIRQGDRVQGRGLGRTGVVGMVGVPAFTGDITATVGEAILVER